MSKSVACNFCGKTYKRPGSLKRHLNICEIICNSKKTTELNQEESDGYTDSDTDSDLSSMPSLEAAGYDDDPYTDYYERGISVQSMGGGTGRIFLGMNVVTGEEDWSM